MRILSTAGQAALGNRCALALFVNLVLDTPLYLTTAAVDIDWSGVMWLGSRGIGVAPVSDRGGEVQALQFSASGVPTESIALALGTPIQGKPIRCYTALMDADTQALLDVMPLWSGTLDQMPLTHGEKATLGVTAEHIAIAMSRPRPTRYTDTDQRRLFPGDRCLEYIVAQATHQDVWPAAAFFQKT